MTSLSSGSCYDPQISSNNSHISNYSRNSFKCQKTPLLKFHASDKQYFSHRSKTSQDSVVSSTPLVGPRGSRFGSSTHDRPRDSERGESCSDVSFADESQSQSHSHSHSQSQSHSKTSDPGPNLRPAANMPAAAA